MSAYFSSLLRQAGAMPHKGEGRREGSPGLEVIHETREAAAPPLSIEQSTPISPQPKQAHQARDFEIQDRPVPEPPRYKQEPRDTEGVKRQDDFEIIQSEQPGAMREEEIPSVRIGEAEESPDVDFREERILIQSSTVETASKQPSSQPAVEIQTDSKRENPINRSSQQTDTSPREAKVRRTVPAGDQTPPWNEAFTEAMRWVAEKPEGERSAEIVESSATTGMEAPVEILPRRETSSQVVVKEVEKAAVTGEQEEKDFRLTIGAINLTVEAEPNPTPATTWQAKPERKSQRSRLRRYYL